MMTIKGGLYVSASTLKWFLATENFPVKIGPQNGGVSEI